jgi:hypothetical protein
MVTFGELRRFQEWLLPISRLSIFGITHCLRTKFGSEQARESNHGRRTKKRHVLDVIRQDTAPEIREDCEVQLQQCLFNKLDRETLGRKLTGTWVLKQMFQTLMLIKRK